MGGDGGCEEGKREKKEKKKRIEAVKKVFIQAKALFWLFSSAIEALSH